MRAQPHVLEHRIAEGRSLRAWRESMSVSGFIVEAVGLLAFATNVWGNILIARKNERGWWVRIVSNVCWLSFGIGAASIANTVNAVTFLGINLYGIRRWRRSA